MTASTPCIDLCVLDPAHGRCVGCGRTVAEITAWAGLSEGQRRSIMALLPARPGHRGSQAVGEGGRGGDLPRAGSR